jgi:hypothetical protein
MVTWVFERRRVILRKAPDTEITIACYTISGKKLPWEDFRKILFWNGLGKEAQREIKHQYRKLPY